MITSFEWVPRSDRFSWWLDGEPRVKMYPSGLQTVCLLNERDGFAVVETIAAYGESNALILNADGSVRLRLGFPSEIRRERIYGYSDMYYILGNLSATLVTTAGDFAVVVTPKTGELSGFRETR